MRVGTIFGASLGFEIIPRKDFEAIKHEALGALLVQLLFLRFTFTRWPK